MGFWRHVLNTAGILLLGFLPVSIWSEREGASLVLLGAITALLVANLESFKRFKASASGLEAETREVINDAKTTLHELRNLAKDFASIFIVMLNAEGRYGGGLNDDMTKATTERIFTLLGSLGLKDSEVDEVRSMERPFVLFDYTSYILRTVDRTKFAQEQHDKWGRARNHKGIGYELSPDQLEQLLESVDELTDERRQLIDDYRFYKRHTRHRRPDVWASRRDWSTPSS